MRQLFVKLIIIIVSNKHFWNEKQFWTFDWIKTTIEKHMVKKIRPSNYSGHSLMDITISFKNWFFQTKNPFFLCILPKMMMIWHLIILSSGWAINNFIWFLRILFLWWHYCLVKHFFVLFLLLNVFFTVVDKLPCLFKVEKNWLL